MPPEQPRVASTGTSAPRYRLDEQGIRRSELDTGKKKVCVRTDNNKII